MSQPDPDPDRYKSRGRKERTPAQLAVLAQAREKAKIVIAERAKLNALQKRSPLLNPCQRKSPLLLLNLNLCWKRFLLRQKKILIPKTKMKNLV
jgi:hypothetical protein